MKMPPEVRPTRPWHEAVARALGAFVSGAGRALCLLLTGMMVWSGLTNPLGHGVAVVGTLLLAAGGVLWWWARRHQDRPDSDRAWRRAGIAVLIAMCIATVAWAVAFDSNQSSDFGIYYRCGTQLKPQLFAWMESCRSNYFHQPDYTYWSRSLVYSAPFGLLAGDNYPLFKLYNAALHVATLALLYFGVRRMAGTRAACVALLLLGLYPEWFFSITVATPDNIVVLFLVGFLLLLPSLFRGRGARAWGAVILLAVLAFLAHLARTVGPFLVAAVVLATLVSLRREHWKQPLLRAAAVVVLYNLANLATVAAVGRPVQGQFAFMERLSTVDLHAPLQNYRLVFAWVDQFLPALPDSARGPVAMHRIVTELAQGFAEYPGYLLAKTRVFAEGVGYYLYSSTDAGANPDSAVTAAFTVPTHPAMLVILAGIVMFVAAAAFIGLLRGRRGPVIDGSCFFVAALFGAVLGFGDTQQRYSLLIVPALAMVTALSLFARAEPASDAAGGTVPRASRVSPEIATTAWTLCAFAAIALVYAAGTQAARWLAARIPQPLAMARQDAPATYQGLQCNAVRATLQGDYKRLRATPPADGSCFSFWAPLPAETQSITFFLSRDEMPFPFEPRTAYPYRIRVEHEGNVLLDTDLGAETVHWYRFDLPPVPAGRPNGVRFIVTPKKPGATEPVNVWWLTPRGKPAP
jgi:hypothetical protein